VMVAIGGVLLGEGRPKVCVPLTGATVEALAAEARAIRSDIADLVEVRIDRFTRIDDPDAVSDAIGVVRSALDPAVPILLTCRSAREGGGAHLSPDGLERLITIAARHEAVDAVDVEMEAVDGVAAALVAVVHAQGKPAVGSFHDFAGTPAQVAIVDRLVRQQALGADVVKLACTPASADDVLVLLAATREYTARADAAPAITMAMGPLGVVSRLAGETFGSALTFGTVGAASAPGQVDARRLRDALDLIHEAQI
jgi:3-dehydroquinate dehydratase I